MVETTSWVDGVAGVRRVWVSTGYDRHNPDAATWEVTLTAAAPLVKFADWSISITEDMILLAEYGPKSGVAWGSTPNIAEGENARYIYQSLDGGYTWSTIFDLNDFLLSNGRTSADGQHLHGVAWDKHWQRIWVTFGDATNDGSNGVLYSDDQGGTWEVAYWTHTHTGLGWQVVGIQPMQDVVLFAGDMTPSGLIALDRSEGRDAFSFYTAWDFSETEKHLCHVIRYSSGPLGEIAMFAFAREGSASPSFIVGTRDGCEFEVLWQESGTSLPGIRSLAGPSADGTVIAAHSTSSGWVEVSGRLHVTGSPWIPDGVPAVQKQVNALEKVVAGKANEGHTHTTAEIADLHHYSGTGFPEGEVAAPVGATYVDTAATNGAIRWVKTSDTGRTGWTVEYGSTGSRDISNLLTDATGTVTIERIGQLVYLEARVIKPEETLGSGSTFLSSLPSGFRPAGRRTFSVNATLSSSAVRSGFQHANGSMGVWSPSTDDIYQISHFWVTTNSWPASLPGMPV